MGKKLRKVTIVVPVYGDWPSLSDCIDSLKEFVDDRHKVMFVNDCGPDVDELESNIKKSIKGKNNFYYFRNEKNLGFVGTCNRAVLEIDKTSNDILLLNSDTIVTEGFLGSMIEVLYESDLNGAVSPRSNNASITTVPLSSAAKRDKTPEESYSIYNKIKNKLPKSIQVPTAHGFCLLIKRSLIKKYGLFDKVFKKGYGEEVDFCRRIKKHGFRSLLANRAYVFHMEARSFSMETKKKLVEENSRILWERYPEYRQEVRDYMEVNVIKETRLEGGLNYYFSYLKKKLKKLLKR